MRGRIACDGGDSARNKEDYLRGVSLFVCLSMQYGKRLRPFCDVEIYLSFISISRLCVSRDTLLRQTRNISSPCATDLRHSAAPQSASRSPTASCWPPPSPAARTASAGGRRRPPKGPRERRRRKTSSSTRDHFNRGRREAGVTVRITPSVFTAAPYEDKGLCLKGTRDHWTLFFVWPPPSSVSRT